MLIRAEEEKLKVAEGFGKLALHRPAASMLAEQYRMHPDIAEIVSDIFYNPEKGKALQTLSTNSEKSKEFQIKNPPFYWLDDGELNFSSKIIWIDLPDIMQLQNSTKYAEKPTWHNPAEREAILAVLERLRAHPDLKPKLAILSAYKQQKISLEREIKYAQRDRLSHLQQFSKPNDHDSFCSTIDSFQGSEADLVIISMVRNNIASTVRSAFGFFLDAQRFNVMLSRARFQQVIVGSFDFLKRWANTKDIQDEKDYHFVCDLVKKLEELETAQKLTIIPFTPTN